MSSCRTFAILDLVFSIFLDEIERWLNPWTSNA